MLQYNNYLLICIPASHRGCAQLESYGLSNQFPSPFRSTYLLAYRSLYLLVYSPTYLFTSLLTYLKTNQEKLFNPTVSIVYTMLILEYIK